MGLVLCGVILRDSWGQSERWLLSWLRLGGDVRWGWMVEELRLVRGRGDMNCLRMGEDTRWVRAVGDMNLLLVGIETYKS